MSDDAESGGDYDLEGYESEDSRDSDVDDNGFFDMEAAESGADSDESDNDNPTADSQPPLSPLTLESDYVGAPSSFPQFMRLPAELRHQIWSLFCPDLVAKSRVFEFVPVIRELDRSYIEEGPFLQQQTAPARAVLATHRESRALALRTLPDTLPLRGGNGVVRFNKEKDVVYLNSNCGALESPIPESVNYLAVRSDAWPFENTGFPAEDAFSADLIRMFLQRLPNLKAVYLHADAFDCDPQELPWLKADKLNSYHFQTYEEEAGLGEDLDFIYCWPDPASDAVPLAEYDILPANQAKEDDSKSGTDSETDGQRRIPLFPLLQFEFEDAVELLNRTMEWRRSGGTLDWGWATASESGSETDEYESEGIDDEEVDADSQRSSEEEDDLMVLPPSEDDSDEDGSGRNHISLVSSDSDTGESEGGPSNLPLHSEYPVASFSSPEAGPGSSSTLEGSEPESSDSEESPVRMVNRPKRRIVSSDVDDDSDGEPATMAERPSKRARIIMSDSEEDDED